MADRRNTRQRQLVLDVVRSRRDHPTVEQIYDSVRELDAHVSRATVYRNLHLLAEAGNILSIKAPASEHFDLRADSHPHIACVMCGAVADVDLAWEDDLDERAVAGEGWLVRSHAIIFDGLCPSCARREGAGS
jgi:Fur family transcriptional regulator, ferric uptake regulator